MPAAKMHDLVLGREPAGPLSHARPVLWPRALRHRHLYTIGKSGKGKSTFFHRLIHQDTKQPYATVVFDAGDLAADVLEALPDRLHDRVMYFTVKRPIPYNPLLRRPDRDRDEVKSRLENELFALMNQVTVEGSSTAPLSARMNRLLSFALRETLKQPAPTLSSLATFLRTETALLRRALDVGPDFTLTRDAILDRLSPFLRDPRIRRIVCNTHELDFGRVIDEGRILIISLAGLEPAFKRFVGTLLFHGLEATILERDDKETRHPVAVYVDEFHDYIKSTYAAEKFQLLFSQGRKFLLSLAVAHTDLGQLPPTLFDTITGTAGSHVAFACGPREARAMSTLLTQSRVDGTAWPPEALAFLPDYCAVVRLGEIRVAPFATYPAPTKRNKIEPDPRPVPPDPPDPFELTLADDDDARPAKSAGRKPRRAATLPS